MPRLLLVALLAASFAGLARADSATSEEALKTITRWLAGRGMRPGGVVRVQQFPSLIPKGATIREDREDDDVVKMIAERDSWLFYVDLKAGPMHSHTVEFVLVPKKGREIMSKRAGWWPAVLAPDGVPFPDFKDGEGTRWWLSAKFRVAGGDGPSIQDAQNAVKFDWMFGKLPGGAKSLVLYSAPITLPKRGAVAVERDGKRVELAKVDEETLLIWVDFHPKTAFPHDARLVLFGRTSKTKRTLELREAPILLGADGKPLAKNDLGVEIGAWYADDAHSFLSRASPHVSQTPAVSPALVPELCVVGA